MEDINTSVYVIVEDKWKNVKQLKTSTFNFSLKDDRLVTIVLPQDNQNVKKLSLGNQVDVAHVALLSKAGHKTLYNVSASGDGTLRFPKNTKAHKIEITDIKPLNSSATKITLNIDVEACTKQTSKYYNF